MNHLNKTCFHLLFVHFPHRIAQTFDQFLSDWEFEVQFSGVRCDQKPEIQNPNDKTITGANGEMGTMYGQSILNSVMPEIAYEPSNESIRRFASFIIKNTDPNNVTKTVQAMFGQASASVAQTNYTPLTGASGSRRNEDENGNYMRQTLKSIGPSTNPHQ